MSDVYISMVLLAMKFEDGWNGSKQACSNRYFGCLFERIIMFTHVFGTGSSF